MVDQFAGGGGGQLDLTGTGDLGARILAAVPDPLKGLVEPVIPNIVAGIHMALSNAIAATFWIGIFAAAVAAILVLFLHEVPMRQTFEGGETLREAEPASAAGSGATAGYSVTADSVRRPAVSTPVYVKIPARESLAQGTRPESTFAKLRAGLSPPRTTIRIYLFRTRRSIGLIAYSSRASSPSIQAIPTTGVTMWSTNPTCGGAR